MDPPSKSDFVNLKSRISTLAFDILDCSIMREIDNLLAFHGYWNGLILKGGFLHSVAQIQIEFLLAQEMAQLKR